MEERIIRVAEDAFPIGKYLKANRQEDGENFSNNMDATGEFA